MVKNDLPGVSREVILSPIRLQIFQFPSGFKLVIIVVRFNHFLRFPGWKEANKIKLEKIDCPLPRQVSYHRQTHLCFSVSTNTPLIARTT